MKQKPELLYLELIKKTLSFTLWPEPLAPYYAQTAVKRFLVSSILKMVGPKGLQIAEQRSFTESQRTDGLIWPGYADTMIGLKRLDNLQHCIETVLAQSSPT